MHCLFLAPVGYPIPPNSAGGFFGLLNSTTKAGTSQNHIIMVEFDSYRNGDWDPPFEHVGINNNSLLSVIHTPWYDGSNSGKLANVWITYNATTKSLSEYTEYNTIKSWDFKFGYQKQGDDGRLGQGGSAHVYKEH
ncbi:hypothetical protein CRYUN_Cryun16bG0094300 [Craigia yunnanensis]